MANARTHLAWLRTAISMAALGSPEQALAPSVLTAVPPASTLRHKPDSSSPRPHPTRCPWHHAGVGPKGCSEPGIRSSYSPVHVPP
ncbi:hypothetical protein [Streptomyces coffeae]|uniref:hypothetical protein n=1 Tax=Streptomyces coffeae TaxID=621382 RepID=UPI00355673AF